MFLIMLLAHRSSVGFARWHVDVKATIRHAALGRRARTHTLDAIYDIVYALDMVHAPREEERKSEGEREREREREKAVWSV